MAKKYREFQDPAGVILMDVYAHGKSEGWSGSLEELEQVKTKLAPFNVKYVDDFFGVWAIRK
jgi:hypothetical protein